MTREIKDPTKLLSIYCPSCHIAHLERAYTDHNRKDHLITCYYCPICKIFFEQRLECRVQFM